VKRKGVPGPMPVAPEAGAVWTAGAGSVRVAVVPGPAALLQASVMPPAEPWAAPTMP